MANYTGIKKIKIGNNTFEFYVPNASDVGALPDTTTIPTIPTDNVIGSGTKGHLAKWDEEHSLVDGPQITASTSAPTNSNGSNGDFWFTYTN